MTVASDLQSIINQKEAIRQAIIAKGVEVPETAKIDVYHEYIDQIPTGTVLPDAPDLSQPLTAQQYADLQKIVAAGKASEYYNLGDTIKVIYDGNAGQYNMPFEIVGFEDIVAQVNGEEKAVHAINLLAKYTSDYSTAYGTSGDIKYSASALRSYITTDYQLMISRIDDSFVKCLGNTKVQTYSRDGSTDVVYDKLFAPSMAQLGVTATAYNNANQAAVEGPAFTAYNGADYNKRIKNAVNATTTAQRYHTRSLYSAASNGIGYVQTSGAPSNGIYYSTYRVVVASNLIGAQ